MPRVKIVIPSDPRALLPVMPAAEDFDEARHVAAATAKSAGSKAYAEGDFVVAARCFGEAIAVATADDPDRAIYRSNRCAARLQLGDIAGATKDATECTELSPKWPKGWSRLGNCLSRQPGRVAEAERALKTAIRLGSADAAIALSELRAKQTASTTSTTSNPKRASISWSHRLTSFRKKIGSFVPTAPSDWTDAVAKYGALDAKTKWALKALCCLFAFFIGRSVFGGPELPFGLGKATGSRFAGRQGNTQANSHAGYGDDRRATDDESYPTNGTLGGLGTVAALGVMYFAYKQGASPYTLMMLANMLGLTGGGRRRGYGGYGMGGMGRGRGGFF